MLPHPAALSGIATACSNKSATGLICGKPVDAHQHHFYGCQYGGAVDRRHAAVARRLADAIQTHNGTKVCIEQTIPGLFRLLNNQVGHARMELVFEQNGITTFIDVAIVTPFLSSPTSLPHPVPGQLHGQESQENQV